ncbi:MAG: type II toxin-antitoxin system RelE/ParE family toxin [Bacteroidetes bacterium]|nr:type II toxin-antitoxin system RelE/ParE family toxin [Bacteroidota bacterium]
MRYKVTIGKKAIKALEKINEPDYSKIKTTIYSLTDNPRPQGYIKLKNRSGYRIRQGNYRIIYDIFDTILVVDVIAIGHRKDIYEE